MFSLKETLKTGMIVKFRDGEAGVVNLEDKIIDRKGGFIALRDLDCNLNITVHLESVRKWDVIEIYEVIEKNIKVKENVLIYRKGDNMGITHKEEIEGAKLIGEMIKKQRTFEEDLAEVNEVERRFKEAEERNNKKNPNNLLTVGELIEKLQKLDSKKTIGLYEKGENQGLEYLWVGDIGIIDNERFMEIQRECKDCDSHYEFDYYIEGVGYED